MKAWRTYLSMSGEGRYLIIVVRRSDWKTSSADHRRALRTVMTCYTIRLWTLIVFLQIQHNFIHSSGSHKVIPLSKIISFIPNNVCMVSWCVKSVSVISSRPVVMATWNLFGQSNNIQQNLSVIFRVHLHWANCVCDWFLWSLSPCNVNRRTDSTHIVPIQSRMQMQT